MRAVTSLVLALGATAHAENPDWLKKSSILTLNVSTVPPLNRTLGDPTSPLALYYGYFNNRDPTSNSLACPVGVEVAFTGNSGNDAFRVTVPSTGAGSAISFRLKPNPLGGPPGSCTTPEECINADNIVNAFARG